LASPEASELDKSRSAEEKIADYLKGGARFDNVSMNRVYEIVGLNTGTDPAIVKERINRLKTQRRLSVATHTSFDLIREVSVDTITIAQRRAESEQPKKSHRKPAKRKDVVSAVATERTGKKEKQFSTFSFSVKEEDNIATNKLPSL
jgi:hypothetical protein